jgi:putative transposase
MPPLRFFDPAASFAVIERGLPHWSQAGTVCFLTWRTWDSMPAGWVERWVAERSEWLGAHGIDPNGDWREHLRGLPPVQLTEFNRTFAARFETALDDCHGGCPLRDPGRSGVVGECLRHLNGKEYHLTDFVVMPNHVHVLAVFPDESAMLARCEAWKRYTAVRLNRLLGRSGRFWQVDGFDHLVRDEVRFDKFRRYIADNPRRAGLKPGEFLWYSTNGS